MKKTFYVIITSALILCSQILFAHGENEYGPHGGYIRMPGAFHTEVISVKNGFKIMLLDINFQHPTVKNSTIKASIKTEKHISELTCKPKANAFFCAASKDVMQSTGTLEIVAERDHAKGALATYPLPLKLAAS